MSMILSRFTSFLSGVAKGAGFSHLDVDRFAISPSPYILQREWDQTPVMMHSLDATGVIVAVSNRWLSTLGYERHEVIGKRSIDFMTPASATRARTIVLPRFFEDGQCDNIAYEMLTRAGEILEVELSAILERDAHGAPLRTIAVIQNVTERNAAERSLARTRALLENTAAIASIGGWEFDLETRRIQWTRQTRVIHGVSDDFIPDLDTALGFYTPEARPVLNKAIETAIQTGVDWDLELPFVAATGERKWVRAQGNVESNGTQPVRLSGTLQDITRQVTKEQAFREANERIEIATENGNIGIWDADIERGETFYSDKWCSLLGYTRTEINASINTWLDLVHPDDRARARSADKAHVEGKTDYFEEQFRMRHKNGRWVWILDRGKVIKWSASGQPKRMIGTHTDITAQKAAETLRNRLARRMELAADSGGIGIWEIELPSGITNWDEWMYRLWGEPYPNQLAPHTLFARSLGEDDRLRIEAATANAIRNETDLNEEYSISWSDGSRHTIRVSARVSPGNDSEPARLIGAAWDVTEEREMADQLAERAELMRITLNSIGDAVVTTDNNGTIEWLNPVAEHLTGWRSADASGQRITAVFNIVNEDTREPVPDPILACLASKSVEALEENTLLISKDGREFSIEDSAAPIRTDDGRVFGAVLVFHDVSEKRRLTREMRYRANHDILTGLVNRSEFDRRLRAAYEDASENGRSGVLLYIDLDRFKVVNDSCGHAAGDQLLIAVGKMIQDNVRAGDVVGRLGGDEFGIFLQDCTIQNAAAIAQKICNLMDGYRFIHDNKRFRIGTSIGIAPVDPLIGSLPVLQQGADAACFVAKENGRNRLHIWAADDTSTSEHSQRLNWAARIEEALDEDRFELYAQRIVPLKTPSDRDKFEILLRMRQRDGTIVMPGMFMPPAERFNLAGRIDRMVISKVLAILHGRSPALKPLLLCINVSGQSLGDRAFHRDILSRVTEAGPSMRQSICLEITETAAITNMPDAVNFTAEMRALGILLALDDFGAGASSFSYLRQLPADVLKIDGQFIEGLLEDPLQEATVRSFIEVARVMKLRIVAEWVSNAAIAAKLSDMGVDYLQGYYFHEPQPFREAFEGFLVL